MKSIDLMYVPTSVVAVAVVVVVVVVVVDHLTEENFGSSLHYAVIVGIGLVRKP